MKKKYYKDFFIYKKKHHWFILPTIVFYYNKYTPSDLDGENFTPSFGLTVRWLTYMVGIQIQQVQENGN